MRDPDIQQGILFSAVQPAVRSVRDYFNSLLARLSVIKGNRGGSRESCRAETPRA